MPISITELSVLVLMVVLTIVLTIYNHRQAAALHGVERLVQDFVAMQIRDRRRKAQDDIAGHIDPFGWLSMQVSSVFDGPPLTVIDAPRIVPDVLAAELHTKEGVRLVVSTLSKAELLRYDNRLRSSGKKKSAKDRVASFASRPLLGNSKWGLRVTSLECVMSQNNEFFDLEAGAVGERLGLKWGNPSRLWFYVAK